MLYNIGAVTNRNDVTRASQGRADGGRLRFAVTVEDTASVEHAHVSAVSGGKEEEGCPQGRCMGFVRSWLSETGFQLTREFTATPYAQAHLCTERAGVLKKVWIRRERYSHGLRSLVRNCVSIW